MTPNQIQKLIELLKLAIIFEDVKIWGSADDDGKGFISINERELNNL